MKKIDICFFSNETDLLLKRFGYYKDSIDVFYVYESDKNFYGQDRDLMYPKISKNVNVNVEYIICSNFHKIDNSKEIYSFSKGPWENEFKFRQYASNLIYDLNNDDIIAISDVDEFYNKDFIMIHENPLTFMMSNNYFCFDYIQYSKSTNSKYLLPGTQLFTKNQYNKFKNTIWNGNENHCFDIQGMRNSPFSGFKQLIYDNAWHFSYFGGIQNIKNKLNNFSHSEYKFVANLSNEEIQKKIDNFEDILGREDFYYIKENNLNIELNNIFNTKTNI